MLKNMQEYSQLRKRSRFYKRNKKAEATEMNKPSNNLFLIIFSCQIGLRTQNINKQTSVKYPLIPRILPKTESFSSRQMSILTK